MNDITEKEWSATIAQLAKTLGWIRYHTHDSRRSTHGFPDEVLVKGRVIFAELKRDLTGKASVDRARMPTPEQVNWLDRLASAGAEVYLWRPKDLDEAAIILSSSSRPFNESFSSQWTTNN